ncbi:hypothetical protein A2767_02045 [Candidatus Roizmanbacteria bacterium RIFCSPHIGHO2_01_FULL_35_10]|uniref:Sodium/calcium exchanger membrane region domain-containing protein n=1 Tax=Candidatus Roizmanbacteria bacterium RIFCSPLOWO2_01_FULL_35_13 TaxID=1802055 RepID=A0A1F7I7C4_9BACT|nr:MAG: hypothetical protein A2767_02045 [Candidatus Roizmanbacteria bacterium RIFCSPHIGHO2_01_FULL_35_10]OGK39243.1 MAG: hypothetical protein A3A74_07465 [Candidatus Roizmanbacteria bacterium RIFCSPLOWO2_01_FULL_35_13]
MTAQIILYIFSFGIIWFAAGIIVNSVDRIAHKLNLSSFSVSFFVLGILTSIPEISVGINSLIDNKPEIFAGNLIGGILVIFLLVIPLLAVFGNGLKLNHQMSKDNLLFALFVILAPSIFILDGRISIIEGLASIFLYIVLIFIIEKKKGLLERIKDEIINNTDQVDTDLVKLVVGVVTVFIVSKFIVDSTIFFSNFYNISPYLISLVILSVGTNLPELSLVFRSVLLKKNEVALGDFLGSAVANTVIFGVLTVIRGSDFLIKNHFLQTFIFVAGGLGLFYIFSRSKQDISRNEGLILLLAYVGFLIVEIM